MQPGIEFHGRLSRSDRRPANPGQYDLTFQIFPKPTSQRVLWSETIAGVDVRSGGFFDVILGEVSPMSADLFSQGARWLGVQVSRSGQLDGEHSPRVPLLGDGVRLLAQLAELGGRLDHLEDAFIGEDSVGRSGRLRALPRRIHQIYTDLRRIQDRLTALESSEETVAIVREVKTIADGLARLSAPNGRLTRIEDELEDLVGPHGDVVDLNERMDALERRGLVGEGEGAEARSALITGFQETLEEISARQDRLERAIRRLQSAPGDEATAMTQVFPVSEPVEPGLLVVVEDGALIPSRFQQDAAVIGVVLSAGAEQAVVAVGGVVTCRVVGPVEVGDILIASEQPGVAEVAAEPPLPGSALARALEPLGGEEGTIRVRLI
jgi:ribosomal protein S28E/S33